MIIKEINIKNVGCIQDLYLNFNDKMNIICGPNSIGKTTILESVAAMFMYGQPIIKRNVASPIGSLYAKIEVEKCIKEKKIEIKTFNPNETEHTNSFTDIASKIISIKV